MLEGYGTERTHRTEAGARATGRRVSIPGRANEGRNRDVFQEAREQMTAYPLGTSVPPFEDDRSGIDMAIIEAYKRGDRVGAMFEGGTPFQPVNEGRLQLALKSEQGTDESSMVDCFLAFIDKHPWNGDSISWVWNWLTFHQKYHGTGDGRTMRQHFALIKFLQKSRKNHSPQENREAVTKVADETFSFGNGCLALVYPLYQYAKSKISEHHPRAVVLSVTRCTHTHPDAIKAVNLLMDIIDGNQVEPPNEQYLREKCLPEQPTAYNTLLTALFIADAGSEMDVIRRGVWVGGDTDSTLATAMLLWALKQRPQPQAYQLQ